MQAENEFLKDKYDTLHTTTNGEREELVRLRTKNITSQTMVVEHQRKLKKMEQDCTASTSQVHTLKQQILRMTAEHEMKNTALTRAENDVVRFKEERERQSSVLEAMRQLEMNLDSRAATNLNRIHEKNARVEEELESSQKEVSNHLERVESLQAQLIRDESTSNGHIERLKGELQGCRGDIDRLNSLTEENVQDKYILQTELEKMKTEVTDRDDIITSLQGSNSASEPLVATQSQVQRLKLEITTARADANAALATALDKDKHIAEFKAIASANEEALSMQTSTLNVEIDLLKEKIHSTSAMLEATQSTLRERQDALKENALELIKIQKEADTAENNWKKEIQDMNNQVSTAVLDCKSATQQQTISDTHAASCDASRKIAEENYQRELLLHAEDTKRVQAVELELSTVTSSRNASETKVAELSVEIVESNRTFETLKAGFNKMNEDNTIRIKDLSTQNNLLHAQLENVTTKIQFMETSDPGSTSSSTSSSSNAMMEEGEGGGETTFSSSSSPSSSPSSSSSSSSSATTSESQLRLLIQHLRKDKNMVEAQLELKLSSCARLEHDVVQLRKKVDELRKQQVAADTSIQEGEQQQQEHAKLLKDVQMMNTFRESNEFLQKDNKELTERNTTFQNNVTSLENQLVPLEESVRTLNADKLSLIAQSKALQQENQMWQNRVERYAFTNCLHSYTYAIED